MGGRRPGNLQVTDDEKILAIACCAQQELPWENSWAPIGFMYIRNADFHYAVPAQFTEISVADLQFDELLLRPFRQLRQSAAGICPADAILKSVIPECRKAFDQFGGHFVMISAQILQTYVLGGSWRSAACLGPRVRSSTPRCLSRFFCGHECHKNTSFYYENRAL